MSVGSSKNDNRIRVTVMRKKIVAVALVVAATVYLPF